MNGIVINLIAQKNFGFIRAESAEYFFHRDDFDGHWDDLKTDFYQGVKNNPISVTFDVIQSTRGPRATNVKRTDYLKQSPPHG